MSIPYHFEKPTITRKSLEEQLVHVFEKLKKQREEQWIDTVPYSNEATAFDDLAEAEKQERKR